MEAFSSFNAMNGMIDEHEAKPFLRVIYEITN